MFFIPHVRQSHKIVFLFGSSFIPFQMVQRIRPIFVMFCKTLKPNLAGWVSGHMVKKLGTPIKLDGFPTKLDIHICGPLL